MQIFVLDHNPEQAAIWLCDKHIVKMPLETAQILCTVHWHYGNDALYKPTHKHHPCIKWACENIANYRWLAKHGLAVCKEYTNRYGKRHKCQDIIEWALQNEPPHIEKSNVMTEHVQAIPNDCKIKNDSIRAYRNYYKKYKRNIATWKNESSKPSWFNEDLPT